MTRIHKELTKAGRPGLLLMGIEKTGQFTDHLEELDWRETEGQRQGLDDGTALVPTTEYVYKHIAPNPNSTKAYGQAVHYGRKIMYKSRNGQHAVLRWRWVFPLSRQTSAPSLGSTRKPKPIRTRSWGQSSGALPRSTRTRPTTIGAQSTSFRRWRSAVGYSGSSTPHAESLTGDAADSIAPWLRS